ncbi:MAG TPA: signal peptidase I [Acidimicrobiaceae bacterium]|nr:signal peptidase I [Acidimicrobiaceae bacterium]
MKTILARLVQFAAALAALLLLVPTSVGGAASYVRVTGNSMYPTLRHGDLVLLSRDDHYTVGDVVAYRSALLDGVVVIHRIIRVNTDGTLVTQGDNNDFVDDFEPAPADVIGVQVLRVPGGAAVSQRLTGPVGIAVVLLGTLMIMTVGARPRHARHRHHSMRGRLT